MTALNYGERERFRRARRQQLLMAILIALGAVSAQAQPAPSMEERLRTQLRLTTAQLQQAQNELAALKANPASAAAPAELEALKRELAKERAAREALDAGRQQTVREARGAVEKANTQIAQYRQSYDELLKLARGAESERKRLTEENDAQKTAIKQCTEKNQRLYSNAQDILRAYESMDLATVLSARQPFAAQSRVKLEEIAQQYGDQLYQNRFGAQAPAQPQTSAE